MPFFKTHRGLNWHYSLSAKGEAVVLLHGFGASGRFWQAQVEFLQKDYQVLVFDLPGHGQSEWMALTLAEIAQDIHEILEACGILKCSLVASSMGGLVALQLYRFLPSSILRISLV
ncbi:MAG: alpha/beta fold hydrolase, partial [Candidatus Omnitrophica bacterium]|nr:alpha/beta fold hydrolase [Candidatus Omnitrophota bacterium]